MYWSKVLGKDRLLAYPASPRGEKIDIKMGEKRVYFTGEAVIVLKGKINI